MLWTVERKRLLRLQQDIQQGLVIWQVCFRQKPAAVAVSGIFIHTQDKGDVFYF